MPKVETPYHDNDLILTPIMSSQSGWQRTWSCPELHMGVLGMEDSKFWHLGGATRWNPQFSINTWTFLAIIFVVSQLFLCLFWISLWLRIGVYNTLASKICVKLLKPPKIQIPTPNTSLSDLLTHSWFHSMLFAVRSVWHSPGPQASQRERGGAHRVPAWLHSGSRPKHTWCRSERGAGPTVGSGWGPQGHSCEDGDDDRLAQCSVLLSPASSRGVQEGTPGFHTDPHSPCASEQAWMDQYPSTLII